MLNTGKLFSVTNFFLDTVNNVGTKRKYGTNSIKVTKISLRDKVPHLFSNGLHTSRTLYSK